MNLEIYIEMLEEKLVLQKAKILELSEANTNLVSKLKAKNEIIKQVKAKPDNDGPTPRPQPFPKTEHTASPAEGVFDQ